MKLFFPLAFVFLVGISSCGNDGEKPVIDSVQKTDSLELINEMIRKDPGNLDLYLTRSGILLRKQDVNGAYADISRILHVDSSKATYLLAAADINFKLMHVARTKQLLERAVELNPDNVDCLLRLAQLYHFITKYDDEMKYINLALHVDVHNAQAYFMKGMVFKEMHDTTNALSSMQTAVEQDPDYYNAYIQLGVLSAAKNLPVAETYYQNALKINPNSEEAMYNLGVYYQSTKNWNAALETYTALLKVYPHNFDAHFNLGIIEVSLKEYDEALKYFNQAIEDNPKEPRGYYGRGFCFERKGDIAGAEADYNMSLKVDSTYDKAVYALNELDKLKRAGGK